MQCRAAGFGHAVAHRGGDRNDGARHQAGEYRWQRGLHAGDRDEDRKAAQFVDALHEPPQARDTDVDEHPRRESMVGQGTLRFARNRGIRASSRDDGDLRIRCFAARRCPCENSEERSARYAAIVELRRPARRQLLVLHRVQAGDQQAGASLLGAGEDDFQLRAALVHGQDGFVEPDALPPLEVQQHFACRRRPHADASFKNAPPLR